MTAHILAKFISKHHLLTIGDSIFLVGDVHASHRTAPVKNWQSSATSHCCIFQLGRHISFNRFTGCFLGS
jgi:hypothetical protein